MSSGYCVANKLKSHGYALLPMLLSMLLPASAATITSFSPTGEVAQVRQARAAFSEAAIKFGDPRAAAPFDVSCSVPGQSRWADDRHWIYDFAQDVPPGTNCSFTLKTGYKLLSGAAVTGVASFKFGTGGPAVLRTMPSGGEIDEEQMFVLFQNAAVDRATLLQHVFCEAEGVHEQIPVRLIEKEPRAQLLKQFAGKNDPARISIVQCRQRLPNGAAVTLVWDKGIATVAAGRAAAVATTNTQLFKFTVRDEFSAGFSCQRENANAACSPILPLTLSFSAPVPRTLAEGIVLTTSAGKVKPQFDSDDSDSDSARNGGGNKADRTVSSVRFKPPFPEKSEMKLTLPSGFKDESGRSLSNADAFPLATRTADYPPLAKFAAAPFGIVELNGDAMLPLTLRKVEQDLTVRSTDGKQVPLAADPPLVRGAKAGASASAPASPGTVAQLKVGDDRSVIAWLSKLNRFHEHWGSSDKKDIDTRSIGLLAREPGVKNLTLPQLSPAKENERPFEVIGIPLPNPGFYVLEVASQKLGASLLAKPAPMYVRTSALVTNLSVHVKLGRENGIVWVTTLDGAAPVPQAEVQISDCHGVPLWRGKTNASGVAAVSPVPVDNCAGGNVDYEEVRKGGLISGLFVSARKTDAKGRADMAFALTSWNDGIESWRFNLPTNHSAGRDMRAHTVFDRTLFRAGETVSMKHVIRAETMRGFDRAATDKLPTRVVITHQGSGESVEFPLTWRDGKHGETVFPIPKQAKLGVYDVTLDRHAITGGNGSGKGKNDDDDEDARSDYADVYQAGSFRVEEFRLPLLQGRITPPKAALIAPREVPLSLQLNYLNGGGAAGMAVQVSSLLRGKSLSFPGYDGYSFTARRLPKGNGDGGDDNDDDSDSAEYQKIVADKLAVTLDRSGAGKTSIRNLPAIERPQELLTEMTYADPNGEVQTVSTVTPVWPSAVVVGMKAGDWVSVKKKMTVTAVVLNTAGQVQAGVPVTISGVARITNSHRKRMVGGFYAYENSKSTQDLGKLCDAVSDRNGMASCEVSLSNAGNVDLVATAKDGSGHAAAASTSVWVTGQGELWFDGENQDRIDILPEKKNYQPGETARFQVRMPFRHATALVAIEREGVIETAVVQLNGQDPTIALPVKASYGPNVYVSVLAVRGRMREVPWYSFFQWGWKAPLDWWHELREYQAPGATVDLAKPAWKFGIAEIAVGSGANTLRVNVASDRPAYPIRSKAKVTIQVLLPDGKPAANAEVAVAAVDEALLELQPNDSWNLLAAMLQRRSYGIETSTAQMQVIGKRHYGRKAMPAGGGGGKSPTRELFDTLLLWKPAVQLDGNGRATVEVPLNDALSSFRIVAVAESGYGLFGTGAASIRSTQDLQVISGLPPLVRSGDRFNAVVTVRNTTARAMTVLATAKATGLAESLAAQTVAIPAGESREVMWPVTVPQDGPLADSRSGTGSSNGSSNGSNNGSNNGSGIDLYAGAFQLGWEIGAQEQGGGGVRDALKLVQRVVPAVPVTVQQATLLQLDRTASFSVAPPAGSLPGRGGLAFGLQATLAGDNEGLRRYFSTYPYACLEQQVSKAVGLHDDAAWQRLSRDLPTYLDSDGLAYYFPPGADNPRGGSDTLTAYLLAISNEAGLTLPTAQRDKMLDGLAAFVEGKAMRNFWSPQKDLDVRKLAALEALSRYGRAQPAMLGSIQINPNLWPTSALLDWIALLQRVATIPERDKRLAEADQILRARLNYQGTQLTFSSDTSDRWWWLMASPDVNAVRLVLTMAGNPAWRDDMPKIVAGAIGRQVRGHWDTTTANAWGTLALHRFAQKFEGEKVAGLTQAVLPPAAPVSFNWDAAGRNNAGGRLALPWPADNAGGSVKLTHDGRGKPWVTMQSLAATPLAAPFSSGYRITKTVAPVEQKSAGSYTRGDVLRVTLEIDAQTDMRWVAVSDPIPGGASLLGTGLGRDSAIAATAAATGIAADSDGRGNASLAYEERSFEAYRSYYAFVPKGKWSMTYTMRLNNVGVFQLPPTRVEAMYAPEMFGTVPNAALTVKAP